MTSTVTYKRNEEMSTGEKVFIGAAVFFFISMLMTVLCCTEGDG